MTNLLVFLLVLAFGIAPLSASPATAMSDDGRIWTIICTATGVLFMDLMTGETRTPEGPTKHEQTYSCHAASARRSDDRQGEEQ